MCSIFIMVVMMTASDFLGASFKWFFAIHSVTLFKALLGLLIICSSPFGSIRSRRQRNQLAWIFWGSYNMFHSVGPISLFRSPAPKMTFLLERYDVIIFFMCSAFSICCQGAQLKSFFIFLSLTLHNDYSILIISKLSIFASCSLILTITFWMLPCASLRALSWNLLGSADNEL